jgi:coenzyme F420-reducing hydrogenase alpha subunit
MNNFITATAARLAAENYIGKPCTVFNFSSKLGVAYEIVTRGCARVALVYMDGRVEWQNTIIPCGFNSRMDHAMYQLMPLAKRVAASW